MPSRIRINGDINTWTLSGIVDPVGLARSGHPVALGVTSPLTGTLLLSAKGAGDASLVSGNGPNGWIPGDFAMLTPHIYLPSGNAPRQNLFALPAGVNRANLASQITTAMAKGSRLDLTVGRAMPGRTVVLDGATLLFVVITALIPGTK